MATTNLGQVRDKITRITRTAGDGSAGTIDTYTIYTECSPSGAGSFAVTNGSAGSEALMSDQIMCAPNTGFASLVTFINSVGFSSVAKIYYRLSDDASTVRKETPNATYAVTAEGIVNSVSFDGFSSAVPYFFYVEYVSASAGTQVTGIASIGSYNTLNDALNACYDFWSGDNVDNIAKYPVVVGVIHGNYVKFMFHQGGTDAMGIELIGENYGFAFTNDGGSTWSTKYCLSDESGSAKSILDRGAFASLDDLCNSFFTYWHGSASLPTSHRTNHPVCLASYNGNNYLISFVMQSSGPDTLVMNYMAGADIGYFSTTDGGTTWNRYAATMTLQ